MTVRKTLLTGTAATVVAVVALTGCSTKAQGGGDSGGGKGDVKTDLGVTDDTITLGALTDASGVFKATGLANTHGNELWVDDINAAGGICGRQIKLNVQDHGYKADNAVPLYEKMKSEVAAMIQVNGSPVLAALKQKLTNEKMLSIPSATASVNLDSESILMIGQTYDVEMVNGLAYLQKEGKIADGDKIGHIYVDSEYGQNSLLGTKAYAKEHKMEVVEATVSASDTDMTATITKLKEAGVKAIALAVTPGALGSVALQNVAQGLNVPMIGNNPTYSVSLLKDQATSQALQQNYLFLNSVDAYSDTDNAAMVDIAEKYKKKYPEEPEKAIPSGYVFGMAFEQILKKACDNGDLTRAGILKAREQITSVDTKGLTGKLDLSKHGEPTSREAYILKVDPNAPTGLVKTGDLFSSKEADEYKAPYQK
ncbi:ABC transporter substrate-binding protein [Cumulibacter manganitolerans]|uniref:ABC transporter substrate-binding protein n=1 Tax=Cumulibacter manganitolerans TaxID=1884992 RepID=UPI001294E3F3|nr:ABC transporter substrate-binding protein [Cumulibacter manganitolerans]